MTRHSVSLLKSSDRSQGHLQVSEAAHQTLPRPRGDRLRRRRPLPQAAHARRLSGLGELSLLLQLRQDHHPAQGDLQSHRAPSKCCHLSSSYFFRLDIISVIKLLNFV